MRVLHIHIQARLAKTGFLFGHLFFNTTNVFCAKKRVGHACTGPSMVNKNLFLGRPACYLLYLLKLYVGKISFSIFENNFGGRPDNPGECKLCCTLSAA